MHGHPFGVGQRGPLVDLLTGFRHYSLLRCALRRRTTRPIPSAHPSSSIA
jgi:hypothetical protein